MKKMGVFIITFVSMSEFKEIHIGKLIKQRVTECRIEISRICNFFKCIEIEIEEMYEKSAISTDLLLKWCKLLDYDFFRIYTQHLILYSPPASVKYNKSSNAGEAHQTKLPQFKKHVYTKGVVDFVLELIQTQQKTIRQVIEEYKIPKTTIYKWIKKYGKQDE